MQLLEGGFDLRRAREVAREALGLYGNKDDFLDFAGTLNYASIYAESPELLKDAMEGFEGPFTYDDLERLDEREKYAVLLRLAHIHFAADMDLVSDDFRNRVFNGEYDEIETAIESCRRSGPETATATVTVTLSVNVQTKVAVPEDAIDEFGDVDIEAVGKSLLEHPEQVMAAFGDTLNRLLAGDTRQLEEYEFVDSIDGIETEPDIRP